MKEQNYFLPKMEESDEESEEENNEQETELFDPRLDIIKALVPGVKTYKRPYFDKTIQ